MVSSRRDGASRLTRAGARFSVLGDAELLNATVEALAEGKAVGWLQGRMEFGPRALGARSILGDPRSPAMQSVLNLKVKYRESFRPFAPSVLREDVADWFELDCDSPYMLLVADVAKQHRREMTAAEHALFGIQKLNVPRSSMPAVTHIDYSARIQTVHADTNPRYHALLTGFKARTGCPVLVNTSFNVRGEPIVATPEDAFRCFMGTEVEVLRGMDETLRRTRPWILCEVLHRDEQAESDSYRRRCNELIQLVNSLDYRAQRIAQDAAGSGIDGLEPVCDFPDQAWSEESIRSCDYLFVPAADLEVSRKVLMS